MARGFHASRVPSDGVAEYELIHIERDERVMVGGVSAFDAVDTGRTISFEELMQRDDTVLFTYDLAQRIVVFMTVPDKAALWKEPFLDRGVLIRDVGIPERLRISVGTPEENDTFLQTADELAAAHLDKELA